MDFGSEDDDAPSINNHFDCLDDEPDHVLSDVPLLRDSSDEDSDSSDDEDDIVLGEDLPPDIPQAGPWNFFGFTRAPDWWFYPSGDAARASAAAGNGHAPPAVPPQHEDDAAAAANAADDDAPDLPDADPNAQQHNQHEDIPDDVDIDSPHWAEYWSRRQLRGAFDAHADLNLGANMASPGLADYSSDSESIYPSSSEDEECSPDFQEQDFQAPGIVDGPWNRSAHVSKICSKGFSISPDIRRRGRKPPPMRYSRPDEAAYINQMIADGILEKGDTQFCVPHFFIRKPGKLRLVFNGKKLNDACKKPPKFNMKSHATLQRLSARHKLHASDDLKNHFFSTKIAESSRKYFGINTPQGTYRYTSLPFGFSWSPFIAHVCVDQICQRAIEAGFVVTHYLDDFHYFGDTLEEVENARDFVRGLLHDAGYRLNMSKEQLPGTLFTALGLEYDLVAKTVRAKPGYISGMRAKHEMRLIEACTVSAKDVASVLGSFIFLNAAYPGSLSYLSPLIAWVKEGKGNWRLHYAYARVAPHIDRALRLFESLPPMPLQALPPSARPTHLYTDASSSGLGLVFPDFIAGYGVPKPKTIYRLEADSVTWALQQLSLPTDFVLRIDNEALVHALHKGRSNIKEANDACAALFRARLAGFRGSAKWISTDLNPADAPSRLHLARSELFVSPFVCEASYSVAR